MKKLVATFLTILSCSVVIALPIGNPSEASLFTNGAWCESTGCDPCDPCFSWCDAWSLRIGFYGDYVFNRHMEVRKHNNGDHTGSDIERTGIFTNAGYLVFNVCDRMDVFATLGATNLHIRTDDEAYDPIENGMLGTESELAFVTDFSWSVGGRATLWECCCFAIGVEAQYFSFRPRMDYFLNYGSGELTYLTNFPRAHYDEWQVGLGASYRFATSCPTLAMVPYLAVKWAGSRLDMNKTMFQDESAVTYTLNGLQSKKLWGYAVGMSFTLCDMIGVTVEGRYADEKAVYVNGQFRF